MRPMRWILALLLAVVVLAGCTSQGEADSGGDMEQAADGGGRAPAVGDLDQTDVGGDADRQVVTTASASLVVGDPGDAADEVALLAEASGGRVDRRGERAADADGPGSTPSAWLTVRVPSGELTALLEALEGLGEVRDLSQSSEDVTRAAQDLDARITALQTSTERLLEIMAGADDSAALIAAETALSERQAELESLQSQRAYLADQVQMSTLDVDLIARDDPRIESGGFLGGIETGWRSLVAVASGLLVGLGVLLPWLVVAVPVVLLVVALRRRNRVGRPAPRQPEPVIVPAAVPGPDVDERS